MLILNLLKSSLKTERIAVDVIIIYLWKKIYHNYLFKGNKTSKILFIVGCQRSGTSLMNRIFTRDINTSVYRESSQLSSDDPEKLRLNSFEKVRFILSRNKAPLIVIKPLVESQNTLELLENFSESQALWMYRHYKDVAKSYLKRFSSKRGILDLKAIIENNQKDWRAEKTSDYVRSIIVKHFSENMSLYDAASLFWFARNQLFYELNLDKNPRVLLCRYEDLVAQPSEKMKEIYDFLKVGYKASKAINEIHSKSVGQGDFIELSPSVEKLCEDLLAKLDNTYAWQQSLEREPITSTAASTMNLSQNL